MGSQKNCLNHPNAPSITMCHQCHKPLCKSCVMVTPMGSFCGSECSVIYKEMKAKLGEGRKKGGGVGLKLIFVVLLIIAGMFGIYFVAKDKPADHFLRKIDVIGRFMNSPASSP